MHVKRLWRRLFFSYCWLPLLILLLLGLFGMRQVRQLYLRQVRDDLRSQAMLCGNRVAPLVAQGATEEEEIDRLCKELGRATGTRFTIVAPDGRVLGDSLESPSQMDNHRHRPEIEQAFQGRLGEATRYSYTTREDRLYVAVGLTGAEGEVQAVVRASLPVTLLAEVLRAFRTQLLIVFAVGVGVHALITLAISRRLSRPLEEIRRGAERFAAGELKHRLRLSDDTEIGALAAALNHMAEQLEERMRTVLLQQNELEAILASMEEGVLAIDNQGRILSLNKACAEMLGDSPNNLQGRSIFEVVRKAELLQFIESALSGGDVAAEELHLSGPEDRWLSARSRVLHDPPRGRIGLLIVLYDVTRLHRLEEIRRDFVANVSHELRTPLTAIKGFLETMLDGAWDEREKARRFLQIMLRQVNRLDALVSDLLLLSRIEKGAEEQTIEMSREMIRDVLAAAVETCQHKAAEKGMRIDLSCPENLSTEINAPLLEQAIINLLDNAIKFGNPDSAIKLRAEVEEADLLISVEDEGCGIEARHLPRIFERFYRVDKARSRELGGTGLGLAIVKHVALVHRGSVSVESKVGVGSKFSLRLPLKAASFSR